MSETPTPKEQLSHALSDLDSLDAIKDQPDFDEATHTEMYNDTADRIVSIFDQNPNLLTEVNPGLMRAKAALNAIKAERAAKIAETDAITEAPVIEGQFQDGALYRRLSPEQQALIDNIYLELLDENVLEEKGTVITSAQEAADELGLELADTERAYGLLSSIEEDIEDGDDVEFVAINFDTEGGNPVPAGEGSTDESEASGKLSNRYIARVRRTTGNIRSLVLDAVPPAKDNAVYILRNDDGSIETVSSSFPSKKEARANGARRVFHNEQTGEAGVLERIHKLLAMDFDKFRRVDAADSES